MSIVDIINSRRQPVRKFFGGGDAEAGGGAGSIPEITVTAPRINPSLGVGMGSLSARMGQISLGNLGINILGAIKDFQIAGMSEAEKKRVLHSTTVIETKESNITCPNCNSLIRPTAKFCVKCGKPINKNEVGK